MFATKFRNWVWGTGLRSETRTSYSRLREIGRGYEGPVFMYAFAEHKDVFGLTARAFFDNVLGARNKFDRNVFDGPRPNSQILFEERQSRRIGPIFRLRFSGNFSTVPDTKRASGTIPATGP